MTAKSSPRGIRTLGHLPFPLEPRTVAPHVAIVAPAYNEELGLRAFYERVKGALDGQGLEWSLLVVNDGSTDGSIGVLDELHAENDRVSYIALSRNFGHQGALAAGLDHAGGDVFVTMDADLQHPPELIADLVGAWRDGYDIVHTRKFATEDLGIVRSLLTRVAYRAIGWVSSVPFVPHASDFRLLDRTARDAVKQLPERGRLYRGLTPWIGFRQAVLPYAARERENGTSNYGMRQLFGLFTKSFFDFSSVPLYAALVLGTLTVIVCVAYVFFVLLAYAFGKAIPPGYVSLVVAVVFLSSVNLTLMGVLSAYVARIYNEVRGRPTYIVARRPQAHLDDITAP